MSARAYWTIMVLTAAVYVAALLGGTRAICRRRQAEHQGEPIAVRCGWCQLDGGARDEIGVCWRCVPY